MRRIQPAAQTRRLHTETAKSCSNLQLSNPHIIQDMHTCAKTIKNLSSGTFLAFFTTAFIYLKKRKDGFPLVTSSLL